MSESTIPQASKSDTTQVIVSREVHARLLRLQGRVQAELGGRPTFSDAISYALDIAEAQATEAA